MIQEKDLVIIGDEAWFADELEKKRARDRRWYANLPESKRQERYERGRQWAAAHPERDRERKRNHMRRKRGTQRELHIVASLHSLRCTGPTRDTGCRCRKQLVVREEVGLNVP